MYSEDRIDRHLCLSTRQRVSLVTILGVVVATLLAVVSLRA